MRDLPDIEQLEDAGLLDPVPPAVDLDGVLGLGEEDAAFEDEADD